MTSVDCWTTWLISSWDKKNFWQNWANSQNKNCLNGSGEKSCHFVKPLPKCLIILICFSTWDNTCDPKVNWSHLEQMYTTQLVTWQHTKPFLSAGVNVNFSETMFVCLFLSRMSVFYTACWSIWSNFGCQMTKSARCTAIHFSYYLFSTYVADAIRQWANHKTYTRYTICCLHSGCLTLKQFHV